MMLIGFGHPLSSTAFVMRGRGVAQVAGGFASSRQVLPTDPQGSMVLTLTNVVVGSRYRVEDSISGVLVTEGTAAATSVALTLDYYSPNQTVKIKVRKGTATPFYRPYETQAVISSADQSIFIAQIQDE